MTCGGCRPPRRVDLGSGGPRRTRAEGTSLQTNTPKGRPHQSGGAGDRASASGGERKEIERRRRLRAAAVYEIVRSEGESELSRPYPSLIWSGIAAGISISLSLIAEGLLRANLPDAPWRPLVENLGYSVGFLVVILGRQQLFTENTITVVLPLMANKRLGVLLNVLRLWTIVFLANMVGTFVSAAALSTDLMFGIEASAAFREVSHHAMDPDAMSVFFRGIVAGFIVAAIVWTLPSAEGNAFLVVAVLTYVIALGNLSHVIAGSVEAFLLGIDGAIGWGEVAFGFILPALAGNVIGGTTLFALISYAQVYQEIETR